jgi:hypothetical protein
MMDVTWLSRIAVFGLGLCFAVITLLSFYCSLEQVKGTTPSQVMLAFLRDYPVVALGIGIVIGHLVWPQRP